VTIPVSIVIPVYATTDQDTEWLKVCLGSCVIQTDDVVVWDDGSEVAIEDFPGARVLHDSHRGKSYARNHAVANAEYELFYPVDADDWLHPRALEILYERWDGVPLYSDVVKVFGAAHQIHKLISFDCEASQRHSLSSVNVLQSVDQWRAVGGWADRLQMYEDWLYNSKLFWMFCGHKVEMPLVYYRQHMRQSTESVSKEDKGKAIEYVMAQLAEWRKSTMGCCGKRRSASGRRGNSAPPPTLPTRIPAVYSPANVDLDTQVADLEQYGQPNPGYVHARYVGGRGMMKHDRRGMTSRKKYTRVMYGGIYQVRREDAVTRDEFQRSSRNCGFIIMTGVPKSPPPAPKPVPKPVPIVTRAPVKQITRVPAKVSGGASGAVIKDAHSMSIRELRNYAVGMDADDLQALLDAEQANERPRIGAVKLLENMIRRATSR